jgi:hypothetical protein
MLNLKKSIIIVCVLLISVNMAFAQQANSKGLYNMEQKMKEIESSTDKLSYLQTFLHEVSTNPAKYCTASKELRDSVNGHMQSDVNLFNFSIFKNSTTDKHVKKINDVTNKAYVIAMQMVFAGEFLPERQKKIDAFIAEANNLIEKDGFLKQLDK